MARPFAAMLAPLLAILGMAAVPSTPTSKRELLAQKRAKAMEDFSQDKAGELSLTSSLVIVVVIITAVVALSLLAALSPTFLRSIAGIVNVFSSGNYTTGDATADNVMPVFGTLIAFLGLFALVGLVFAVVQIKHGGGGA